MRAVSARELILGRLKGRIGDVGREAEKRGAERLGGRPTPGSGCGNVKGDHRVDAFMKGDHRVDAFMKGDHHVDAFKVEVKSTQRASISLKHEWLLKITEEAHGIGREPALQILFTRGDGTPVQAGAWVAVPESLFREMISDP